MGRVKQSDLDEARLSLGEFELPDQVVSPVPTLPDRPRRLAAVGEGRMTARADQAAQPVPVVVGEDLDTIRRVWGASLLEQPRKVHAILQARSVLSEESLRMLRSALAAGRALRVMADELSSDELDRGLRGHRDAFPGWAPSTLSKLISIARFVDDTRLPIEILPKSWTVLYEFTTLASEELERARNVKLLRPDVTRADIQHYKRTLRSPSRDPAVHTVTPISEIERLDERIAAAQAELASLRRQRRELADALGKKGRGKTGGVSGASNEANPRRTGAA